MAKRKTAYLHTEVMRDPAVVLRPVVRTTDQEMVDEVVTMESAQSPSREERDRSLRLALDRESDDAGDPCSNPIVSPER